MIDCSTFCYNLFENIHEILKPPTESGKSYFVNGKYLYFHYECDGTKDSGWGCGYRTLQSICSWIINKQRKWENPAKIPSLQQIQQTLVDIGDKPATFFNSCEWIGALEVFYVIDTLYDVSCKIQHIGKCDDVKKYTDLLKNHFETFGSLVMMGGDIDAASKGIAGVHISNNDAFLLIIDPHLAGVPKTNQEVLDLGYVRWQNTNDFIDSSFYNLCLPQLK